MHFSKTYAQLLVTLPTEFQNNAFEYRRLKRLINQTASELDSLGLGPSVLQSWHEQGDPEHGLAYADSEQDDTDPDETLSESKSETPHKHVVVYEIVLNSSLPEPRLRLFSGNSIKASTPSTTQPIYHVDFYMPEQSFGCVTRALLRPPIVVDGEMPLLDHSTESDHVLNMDMIIPLPSDMAFFRLLASNLSSLSGHSDALRDSFNSALTSLAASISSTARPASFSAPRSFSAYSPTADNAVSLRPSPGGKSDLNTWREIFRLYAEAEIFESVRESIQGERGIEGAEGQLKLFRDRIQDKRVSLVLPGSREALEVFLSLNWFILDVKKFQLANSEATRKILKKHAKRTTLPIPPHLLERDVFTGVVPSRQVKHARRSQSLPRLLVQAIGEVLLPIVPHIDDYACLICTSIAFKPVRLCCNHFFCVRCLVKMQKRYMPHCPMCRAPTVLKANPSNIDYGLLNFMADWFPIESLEKLHANEQEVTREQLEAFGIADVRICRIM